MNLRGARNLVFDADCALLDGDVKKARELLRQADRMLREMQKDESVAGQVQGSSVPALRGESVGIQRAAAVGGRRRLHCMHEGTTAPARGQDGTA